MNTSTVDPAVPILLVDDDPSSLAILRNALNGHGYRIFLTRNGEDALKVARREHPMVVLLDVMMPGMDGFEPAPAQTGSGTGRDAVIFLSALEDTRDKVRGLEAGAVDFITKPFQSDEVVARVKPRPPSSACGCNWNRRTRR